MLFFGPVKSPKYGAVSFSGSYASMPGGIGRLMSEARIMLIESDMKRILGINMGVSWNGGTPKIHTPSADHF